MTIVDFHPRLCGRQDSGLGLVAVLVAALPFGYPAGARRGYVDLSRNAEAGMEVQRALLFPGQREPAARS